MPSFLGFIYRYKDYSAKHWPRYPNCTRTWNFTNRSKNTHHKDKQQHCKESVNSYFVPNFT